MLLNNIMYLPLFIIIIIIVRFPVRSRLGIRFASANIKIMTQSVKTLLIIIIDFNRVANSRVIDGE